MKIGIFPLKRCQHPLTDLLYSIRMNTEKLLANLHLAIAVNWFWEAAIGDVFDKVNAKKISEILEEQPGGLQSCLNTANSGAFNKGNKYDAL